MTKKHLFLISILVLYFITGNAQTDSTSTKSRAWNAYMGIGGSYSSFQDVRYSNVKYSGIGANLEIGFNKKKEKYFWETAIILNYNKEKAKTHSSGKSTIYYPNLYFKYLRALNENFLIGGRIDVFDFYFKTIQGLGNNGTYYITSSSLFGSLIYNKRINDKWHLQSSIDLGLFSFMKESTSFAFSASQNILDDGEFDYQNEDLSSPFGFDYFELKHIGNNINIKTSFLFQYKERISIGYSWYLRRFASVKSYPVTLGIHNITFRYNILHK